MKIKKFGGKYNIDSNRFNDNNYSHGCYFVTINTKNRKKFLGEIKNGKMKLNRFGIIAHKILIKINKQFPHVKLDAFIIMPNHVHAIIYIKKGRGAIYRVSNNEKKITQGGCTGNKNPMINEGLGTVIRWYKGRTTYEIRKLNKGHFAWQKNYNERIIRNDIKMKIIRNYIMNNIKKWGK